MLRLRWKRMMPHLSSDRTYLQGSNATLKESNELSMARLEFPASLSAGHARCGAPTEAAGETFRACKPDPKIRSLKTRRGTTRAPAAPGARAEALRRPRAKDRPAFP